MKAKALNRRNEPSSQEQTPQPAEARNQTTKLGQESLIESREFKLGTLLNFARARPPQPDEVDKVDSHYMMCAYAGFRSRNTTDALLAIHAAVTHQLAMQQATQMSKAEHSPVVEFAQRSYVELSRLFFEQVNAITTIQNTQNNHINIGTVSVEKGSQANIGCMTNASTIEARTPKQALKNSQTSDPGRPRRRRATST